MYTAYMSPGAYTIIGTGLSLAALNVRLLAWIRGDIHRQSDRLDKLRDGMYELRERMARLEGLLEGLREAISGRRAA